MGKAIVLNRFPSTWCHYYLVSLRASDERFKALLQSTLIAIRIGYHDNASCWFCTIEGSIDAASTVVQFGCHFRNQADSVIQCHQLLYCCKLAGAFNRERVKRFLSAK